MSIYFSLRYVPRKKRKMIMVEEEAQKMDVEKCCSFSSSFFFFYRPFHEHENKKFSSLSARWLCCCCGAVPLSVILKEKMCQWETFPPLFFRNERKIGFFPFRHARLLFRSPLRASPIRLIWLNIHRNCDNFQLASLLPHLTQTESAANEKKTKTKTM